jgi:hypothetical protein
MITTYTVADYLESDRHVEVTYTNDEGFVHKRTVNIPHLPDGSIDGSYFSEILEGQLRGVNNKLVVGAITFIDPNADVGISTEVGIGTT